MKELEREVVAVKLTAEELGKNHKSDWSDGKSFNFAHDGVVLNENQIRVMKLGASHLCSGEEMVELMYKFDTPGTK